MSLCSLHMKIENAVQPKRWWTASQGSPGRHAQGGVEDEAIPQMEVNSSLKQRTSSFATVTQRLVNSQETCTTSLGASWIRYRADRSWGHWLVSISLPLSLSLWTHPLSRKVSLSPQGIRLSLASWPVRTALDLDLSAYLSLRISWPLPLSKSLLE